MSNARELFLSRRAGEGISIAPDRVVLTARRRRQVAESLEEILRLAELAASKRVRFDYQLTEALRREHGVKRRNNDPASGPLTKEASQIFLRFLEKLGRSIRFSASFTGSVFSHESSPLSNMLGTYCNSTPITSTPSTITPSSCWNTWKALRIATTSSAEPTAPSLVKTYSIWRPLARFGKRLRGGSQRSWSRLAIEMASRLHLTDEESETLVFLVHNI